MNFAIRVGLAPPGATSDTHGDIRNMVKPISLGSNYGMSKYGAAAQSGKSLVWAATTLAAHRHAYPVFAQWQQNMTAQALFAERITSVFGWPMAVHAETKRRTLLNYPCQANGGECMRLAAIAAYEAGIRIAAPAHDAFWIWRRYPSSPTPLPPCRKS
jgi:DNA polymerase I-like protein with 3'-5' exonuclease and polymerase domains